MLSLENIHTFYGKIEALKGISLEVPRGNIVTLIGANGAGKTTTLMTVSGIIHPKRGEIIFKGKDITELSPWQITRLGISHIPEGRRIFSRLTVKENLELGAFTRNDIRLVSEDMKNVFELFPVLKDRLSQLAGTLSGGEQQMLAIGRGLMSRPELLILDEPSLGLAPRLVETVFKTIIKINQMGMTILLVEQNANMALKISNYGYALETGKIVFHDISKNLLQNDAVKRAYLGKSECE